MNWLIALPIVLPLVTACLSVCAWRSRIIQRWLTLLSMTGMLAVGILLVKHVWDNGVTAVQMAGYDAPYGISFVADLFSAIMVTLASFMGVAIALYSLTNITARREAFGYHPMLQLLLMGVNGAFLTGDIFNLYVFFEILLMSSFVLLTLGGERGQIEGAIKYVTLNLISSAIFLAGVGIAYGMTGTLNMADLAARLADVDDPGLPTVLSMMFLVAFGVKAAMFPLFFWLPASYHTPPAAVSAIFAALLTKVGVYSLVRVFTLIFNAEVEYTHTLILIIAGLSMVTGVLGAAAQSEFRRILAFHSVSQIGYMLMGLGLVCALGHSDSETTRHAVQLGLAGTIYFIGHHLIVKPALFLVSGIVEHRAGTGELKHLGGFYRAHPGLSILFLVAALSLAGIPPLSGFWAKVLLIMAAIQVESYVIVLAALATGLLTLYSMVKIWAAVFWSPAPEHGPLSDSASQQRADRGMAWLVIPVAVMAVVIVAMGLLIGPALELAMAAAEQLLNPQEYIDAVGSVTEILDESGENGAAT